MPRHHDAPGQGFLFPDEPKRVNRTTPAPLNVNTDWGEETRLPALGSGSSDSLPPSIGALIERCNLSLLDRNRFGYRRGQVECIYDICSTPKNFAVKGALGSGKTNVALAVAAQYLSRGESVIYLTPFENLVSQTAERAAQILLIEETRIHTVRDDWTPKKRGRLYTLDLAVPEGHLVITTPGKILNDIIAGRIDTTQIARLKLAIFDECHLAFGKLPYVELMERFTTSGARLLGFTGTMGKDKAQRAIILQNIGVNEIYSLATPVLKQTVLPPKIVELDPTLTVAAEQLGSVAKSILTALTDHLSGLAVDFGDEDTGEVSHAIRERHLAGPRFAMPVKKAILTIHREVRELVALHSSNGAYYQAATLAHALDQVQQLHDRLTRFGRYAFLRLAADKLLALNIPDLREEKPAKTAQRTRASLPRYVHYVYRDHDVLEAYHAVAAGTPFEVVPKLATVAAALRAIPGEPARIGLAGAELRQDLLAALRQQLAWHDYSDHPKEAAVFSILARDAGRPDRKPTIIVVEQVEAARFLVDRIHTTKDIETRAVLCVGAGHDVEMSRTEAIRAFDSGAAHVIVATSALEVGQDTQTARRISNYIQTPEAIRWAQRTGRAGRDGTGAEIIDLVTKHYEPQYFAGRANVKKMNDA